MGRGSQVAIVGLTLAMMSCELRLRRCSDGCVNGATCDPKTDLCVHGLSSQSPYERIVLFAPARAGRQPITIAADLVLKSGASRADPLELVLTIDGGVFRDDAGVAVTILQLEDAGHFRATGVLPAIEGPQEVYVATPDAGLAAATTIYVDITPPTVVVGLSTPPARQNATDGGLVELDVEVPGAFRRDESVTVTIDTPEPLGSTIAVEMFSDGGGHQQLGQPDAGCVSRFDGGGCYQRHIDLWRHPMRAYRDAVAFTIQVWDDVGNSSTVDAGRVSVTRFKWTRGAPTIRSSTGLTRDGTILFDAFVDGGHLFAWRPDGTNAWSQSTGTASGNFAVGASANEHIYHAGKTAGYELECSATPTSNPLQRLTPLFPVVPNNADAVPLITNDFGPEVVWFISSSFDAQISAHTWRLADRATDAVDAGPGFWLNLYNGPFTNNLYVFIPALRVGMSPELVVARLGANVTPEITRRISVPAEISSTAVTEDDLIYLGLETPDGGVLQPLSAVGVLSQPIPVPMESPNVIIGENAVYVSGFTTASSTLCRVPIGGGVLACAALRSGGMPILGAAPTPGAAPILYVPALGSAVEFFVHAVDAQSLTVLWSAQLPSIDIPISIDCSRGLDGSPRRGVPGVLYSVSNAPLGQLRATIVDSPGIDGTAQWPMQSHDPRNTGNSQMPLTPFYCP